MFDICAALATNRKLQIDLLKRSRSDVPGLKFIAEFANHPADGVNHVEFLQIPLRKLLAA
jgi:hypothetical protein